MKTVRIVTPTGHLGTTPLEKASFERGCVASPDFIVADSGSADIGPYPLGADRAMKSGSVTTSRRCCWRPGVWGSR